MMKDRITDARDNIIDLDQDVNLHLCHRLKLKETQIKRLKEVIKSLEERISMQDKI